MPKRSPKEQPPSDKGGEEKEFITHEIRIRVETDAQLAREAAHHRYGRVATYIGAILDDRCRKLTGKEEGPSTWFPDPRLIDIANLRALPEQTTSGGHVQEDKQPEADTPLINSSLKKKISDNLDHLFDD